MLKPDSFILRKTATLIAVIVQVFCVYLFFRGHNQPGGGFIAGVGSAIGILLLILANGKQIITKLFPFDPLKLCAWGLAIAFISGMLGPVSGKAFLTHFHYKDSDFPFFGSVYLGTPLLFDLGVFLTVLGVIMKVMLVLMDALDAQKSAGMPAFNLPMGKDDSPLEKEISAEEKGGQA